MALVFLSLFAIFVLNGTKEATFHSFRDYATTYGWIIFDRASEHVSAFSFLDYNIHGGYGVTSTVIDWWNTSYSIKMEKSRKEVERKFIRLHW